VKDICDAAPKLKEGDLIDSQLNVKNNYLIMWRIICRAKTLMEGDLIDSQLTDVKNNYFIKWRIISWCSVLKTWWKEELQIGSRLTDVKITIL
jgi:hypothetical protein